MSIPERRSDSNGAVWEYVVDKGITKVRRVWTPEQMLVAAGVPERIRAVALSPHQTEALKHVEEWLAGGGINIVLSGSVGRGKSVAAARALALHPGRWVSAPALARIPEEGETRPEKDMIKAAVLVLDEVGAEHSPSGYARNRIEEVLVARDATRRPTILTTNLGSVDFAERYGDRIVSRISGDKIGGFRTCTGPDYRRRKGLEVVPSCNSTTPDAPGCK